MKTTLAIVFATSALVAQDPVVLTGAELPGLVGKRPDRILAYRYHAKQRWQRVAMQIDERAVVPYRTILQRRVRKNLKGLVYTDPNTFTGADPDPNFDKDDELVLLASAVGEAAPATDPAGVLAGSRTELVLPGRGRIYLFAAKTRFERLPKRVKYTFNLDAGEYLEEYDLGNRSNPEHSTITAPSYRLGFRDRWIMDELRVTVGDVSGVDLLDRHKVQVIPGNCIRTTKTFSQGSGAIIANIDGPVRAIRAVIGANSGPLTERIWYCYPKRFDIVTHLRVHPLPSCLMFFDYSAAALGMRYQDNLNPGGFVIDGKVDPAKPGKMLWQFLTGKPGSLLIHYGLETTIQGLRQSSLYDDNKRPKWNQCTGDNCAFGAGGPLLHNIVNTDPRFAKHEKLTSRVVIYPGAANRMLGDPTSVQMPKPVPVRVRVAK